MTIYIVIKKINDYPECGGGKYTDAVFLNYANADKYVTQKKIETNALGKTDVFYSVEAWETADKMER